MKSGKVKFFDVEKGFGFIVPDGGGKDIFFHVSSVKGGAMVDKEDKVKFVMGEGKKGPCAVDIDIVKQ